MAPAASAAAAGPARAAISGAPSTARCGPQPFVTLFCQFPDTQRDEGMREYYQALLGEEAPGMADYWREVSYGQMSLDGSRVAGWYLMPHSSGDYKLRPADDTTLRQLAEECTAAAEADIFFPDYAGINLVFSLCPGPGYGARSTLTLDGQQKAYGVTWLCRNRPSWHSTVAHEMGHALGMHHTSDGSPNVYSNPWDAMSYCAFCRKQGGFGPVRQHPIAYQKDRLGWIPPARKYLAVPGSRTQIKLEQLAQPQTDNYLMAVIPLLGEDGRYYTVEARRRVGYDRNVAMDAVVMHRTDPNGNPEAVLLSHPAAEDAFVDSAWVPGMVFRDARHGVEVLIDAATETGFVVTIAVAPSVPAMAGP